MKPYVDHEKEIIRNFRNNPELAAAYLNEVLTNGDQAELMTALRRVALASGGVQAVAEASSLNPTSLYRTLSPRGNPELKSFLTILKSLGMTISIIPMESNARSA